ncbi:alpha/beta hydrolase family protein [Paenibacillus albiflavus]|nr:alpha/beta hydrolase [Paenibacillus albiflavus]
MKYDIHETDVTIEAPDGKLAGTIAIPVPPHSDAAAKHPAILLIAGSGSSDRNGNSGGIDANIYHNLSNFLISLGFVTLRYDKRGTHKSEGDFNAAGLWDLVDDAEACLQYLKSHPNCDPENVFVLGHSEGAIFTAILASRNRIAGAIMLAGFADTGKVMLTCQAEQVLDELEATKGFKGFLMRLLRLIPKARKRNEATIQQILASTEDTIKLGPATINAKWYREHYATSVLDYLPQMTCPVLAITGDRDIQVNPQHVHIIADLVKGPVETHIIPEMNHLLCRYTSTHTMLKLQQEYQQLIGSPLHQELLPLLESWLHKQLHSESTFEQEETV